MMAMRLSSFIGKTLERLTVDKTGNIALTFALTAVPLLIAMGTAFDYSRARNQHFEMQAALDAALVAAVNEIGVKDEAAIKAQIANWLAAEASVAGSYSTSANKISIDATNVAVTARVAGGLDTSFLGILGIERIPISVEATVAGGKDVSTQNAFSMYFVLDRSGSMDEDTNTTYTTTCYWGSWAYKCLQYYTKMESLKLASADLLGQFAKADPTSKYVRTGAVSYDTIMDTPTPLAWGTSASLAYIKALTSRNSTNSGEAFQKAYESLTVTGNKSEQKLHEAKSGVKNPTKYIVFMTDGANNVNGADSKTKQYCDKARVAKITVYSIAFMAPAQGQALLKHCATTSADYFPAENTAQLVAAFKLIGQTAAKTLVRITS
jgi:Flp pilus assembly protein TadG